MIFNWLPVYFSAELWIQAPRSESSRTAQQPEMHSSPRRTAAATRATIIAFQQRAGSRGLPRRTSGVTQPIYDQQNAGRSIPCRLHAQQYSRLYVAMRHPPDAASRLHAAATGREGVQSSNVAGMKCNVKSGEGLKRKQEGQERAAAADSRLAQTAPHTAAHAGSDREL